MLRLFIMKGGFVCTQIHVRSSLGNRFQAVRRIRFAVRLCPLSALFCTPFCNLTVLNFCCPRWFVFSEWRTAVACSSFIDRLQLVCFVKGNSLFPFFRGCPSPLSATPTFLPDPFVSFTDIFPRSGKSPALRGITRQHFWKTAAPKNFLVAFGVLPFTLP